MEGQTANDGFLKFFLICCHSGSNGLTGLSYRGVSKDRLTLEVTLLRLCIALTGGYSLSII